ncbi:MAG: hypothetical protein HY744_26090 [Deltaproteobacteria bacterium]|nr:hypothetical protein [Deltaproteobacteria bacterium]
MSRPLLVLGLALLLAGCGGGEDRAASPPLGSPGSGAAGAGATGGEGGAGTGGGLQGGGGTGGGVPSSCAFTYDKDFVYDAPADGERRSAGAGSPGPVRQGPGGGPDWIAVADGKALSGKYTLHVSLD